MLQKVLGHVFERSEPSRMRSVGDYGACTSTEDRPASRQSGRSLSQQGGFGLKGFGVRIWGVRGLGFRVFRVLGFRVGRHG